MGLWAWMTNQIFTRKFWQGVKKDGLILTYIRGHKAMMHAHAVGGIDGNAKFVGQDEFGNRYYEDLDFIHPNQSRWVEFADYHRSMGGELGDRVPPAWHGWLAHTYDDVPTVGAPEFVKPYYLKSHGWSYTTSPTNKFIPKFSIQHPKVLEYQQYRKGRYADDWNPQTKRESDS